MPAFALFLFAGSPSLMDLHLGKPAALGLNALLCALFFLQHSGMVRERFQKRIQQYIPKEYTPAVYASASGAVLWLMMLLWQSIQPPVLQMENPFRILARIFFLFSIAGSIWGNVALQALDPLGIHAVLRYLRNSQPRVMPFMISGPYRWVRHPLYFFSLVMIWACPDWTMDRLMFSLLWTAWLIMGTFLEERDLVKAHGQNYQRYQQEVPMLIPRRLWMSDRDSQIKK